MRTILTNGTLGQRTMALGVAVIFIAGCVHGEAQAPKCSGAEQAVITSNVYDHSADNPSGNTYSCEGPCPSGQTRVVSYEDFQPELRLMVFNGQWQKRYKYTCLPECKDGEKMARSEGSRSESGVNFTYSCYNVAEREAKQAATKAAEAQSVKVSADCEADQPCPGIRPDSSASFEEKDAYIKRCAAAGLERKLRCRGQSSNCQSRCRVLWEDHERTCQAGAAECRSMRMQMEAACIRECAQ